MSTGWISATPNDAAAAWRASSSSTCWLSPFPLLRKPAPEVGHAPRGREAARVHARRIGRGADEARMRPARRQAHDRFVAGRQDAQLARAFDLDIELERVRIRPRRRSCRAPAPATPRLEEADARRAGHEPLRLAVPGQVDRAGDAPGIADAEADAGVDPRG